MKKIIIGENVFKVPSPVFALGPSASGYTLKYSCDYNEDFPNSASWQEWKEETPADEAVTTVTCLIEDIYFKLEGNTSNVCLLYNEKTGVDSWK